MASSWKASPFAQHFPAFPGAAVVASGREARKLARFLTGMKGLYAVCIIGFSDKGTVSWSAFGTLALSEKEALGIAYERCLETFPEKSGWTKHRITVNKVPDTAIIEAYGAVMERRLNAMRDE